MENNTHQSRQKNIWNLVAGLVFLGLGSYRIYNHFFVEGISYTNIRLMLFIAFIGYGLYKLYNYLNGK